MKTEKRIISKESLLNNPEKLTTLNKNFANFNISQFPKVFVKLNKSIKSDDDYDKFTNDWLNLYKKQKYYNLVIDTTQTGLINVKYAFKVANFIKGLKENVPELYGEQWLQYSVILVSNNFIMKLLNIIFKITKPIAPIYIVSNEKDKNTILDSLSTIKLSNYNSNIKHFKKNNIELLKNKISFKFIDSQ